MKTSNPNQSDKPEIILTYKGFLTFDLVNAILTSLEPKLKEIETNIQTRKRLYSVLTECLQNIAHHGDEMHKQQATETSDRTTHLQVISDADSYKIQTENTILNNKIQDLDEWLDAVNELSSEELHHFYKKMLDKGVISEKGTAGLGYLDIARKSGNPFKYHFRKVNTEYSIFHLEIIVLKGAG